MLAIIPSCTIQKDTAQAKRTSRQTPRPNQSGSCTDGVRWNEHKCELLQVSPSWRANIAAVAKGEDARVIRDAMVTFVDAAPGAIFTAGMKKALVTFVSEVRLCRRTVYSSKNQTSPGRIDAWRISGRGTGATRCQLITECRSPPSGGRCPRNQQQQLESRKSGKRC